MMALLSLTCFLTSSIVGLLRPFNPCTQFLLRQLKPGTGVFIQALHIGDGDACLCRLGDISVFVWLGKDGEGCFLSKEIFH